MLEFEIVGIRGKFKMPQKTARGNSILSLLSLLLLMLVMVMVVLLGKDGKGFNYQSRIYRFMSQSPWMAGRIGKGTTKGPLIKNLITSQLCRRWQLLDQENIDRSVGFAGQLDLIPPLSRWHALIRIGDLEGGSIGCLDG